jgi:hypothetical protein
MRRAHQTFFDTLLALIDEHDRLKATGQPIAARVAKETAEALLDRWIDDADERLTLEALEMEQAAAARESAGRAALDIDPFCEF